MATIPRILTWRDYLTDDEAKVIAKSDAILAQIATLRKKNSHLTIVRNKIMNRAVVRKQYQARKEQ